ncbi:MAG: mechanosensitive ion channel domain-containing protein, partial [Verrucomicrobiales bacterium]
RSSAVDELLARRVELLGELEAQTAVLLRDRSMPKSKEQAYAEKVREVRQLLNESLFWMRSSAPINTETVRELPEAITWLFGTQGIGLMGASIVQQAARWSVPTALVAIIVALLVVLRPRLKRSLEDIAVKIRRISTDRYAYTLRALGDTLLLSLPVPIVVGFTGWLLWQGADRDAWHTTIGIILGWGALVILPLWFTAEICRKQGVGNAHFSWPQAGLSRIRRSYFWLIATYPPALLINAISFFADDGQYFDSLGRVSFMLVHLFLAVGVWGLLCSNRGAMAPIASDNPERHLVRWQKYWVPIVIACPVALVGAAAIGYLRAAFNMSLELLTTVVILSLGVLAYQLVLRWFSIRERKHALAELLERRRSMQEVAADDGEETETGDFIAVDFEEDELDLRSSGEQTRHLLSFLFAAGTAFAVIFFWSRTIPALASLHTVRPLLGLSLSQLGQLVLILAIMTISVKNLPGLLELAVLRRTSMSVGTRHAVSTLFQYAVIAIGLAALFEVLQVDWTKFGWIAAALSVGLGFGLQEVVANFVCGLILLFERPIRVGDIVTLDEITGKVTKIRIRATSVTDWDQKEFVVPNKNIITGTLLNWTLSSTISRIVLTVGVAYGTDTEEARRILSEVAADHPLILDDPVPTTSFEEFADSSLTLRLRAFLPDPDNRVRTVTELHTEIDRRFAKAGIEISFPQRDLHLRGKWPPPLPDTKGEEREPGGGD